MIIVNKVMYISRNYFITYHYKIDDKYEGFYINIVKIPAVARTLRVIYFISKCF